MALDTVGSPTSYLDGAIIIPPLHKPDATLNIIINDERRRRQADIRQRIGLDLPEMGDELVIPTRPHRFDDDDEPQSDRGYSEIDM